MRMFSLGAIALVLIALLGFGSAEVQAGNCKTVTSAGYVGVPVPVPVAVGVPSYNPNFGSNVGHCAQNTGFAFNQNFGAGYNLNVGNGFNTGHHNFAARNVNFGAGVAYQNANFGAGAGYNVNVGNGSAYNPNVGNGFNTGNNGNVGAGGRANILDTILDPNFALPIAGGVGGAIVGGPLGAGLGVFAGQALGRVFSGNPNQNVGNGRPNFGGRRR